MAEVGRELQLGPLAGARLEAAAQEGLLVLPSAGRPPAPLQLGQRGALRSRRPERPAVAPARPERRLGDQAQPLLEQLVGEVDLVGELPQAIQLFGRQVAVGEGQREHPVECGLALGPRLADLEPLPLAPFRLEPLRRLGVEPEPVGVDLEQGPLALVEAPVAPRHVAEHPVDPLEPGRGRGLGAGLRRVDSWHILLLSWAAMLARAEPVRAPSRSTPDGSVSSAGPADPE